MTIYIYDKANGLLQFETEISDPTAAWSAFGADLGYTEDEPGLFERSAYIWTTQADPEATDFENFPA